VKFFDAVKGLGYVKLEDGRDVFVDRRALRGEGFRYLAAGEQVEVTLAWDPQREQDVGVSVAPLRERLQGQVIAFDWLKGFGFVQPAGGGPPIFVHHTDILGQEYRKSLEPGERVLFKLTTTDRGPQAVQVKRSDPRSPLDRFASMGNDRTWPRELAALAEPEPWDHRPLRPPRFSILRSYVTHTFARLADEDKIAFGDPPDGPRAGVNTGLVTPMREPILALFHVNRRTQETGTRWRLTGFFRVSDHPVVRSFQRLPQPARYYDTPAELIFDARLPLVVDFAHIVDDHMDRLPAALRDDADGAMVRVQSACLLAQQEVVRDYRTAVPQFHRGQIQMLLPLRLQRRGLVDLALVTTRVGDQYRGDTVLPLEMAYNNARLLGRPNSEWLGPLRRDESSTDDG
jgi:cold shock CspA family protein